MPKFKVSLSVTTTIILLLVIAAATTVSTTATEDAFAEQYRNNRAAAASNSCLNPLFETSTLEVPNTIGNCGNTFSQQEEFGQASSPITLQTASPTIEVQTREPTMEEPTPEPLTCEECFTSFLSEAVIQNLLEVTDNASLEDLCQTLENAPPVTAEIIIEDIEGELLAMGVDRGTIQDVGECLKIFFGLEDSS